MEPIIRTQDLTRRFGELIAVDHVSLSVFKGEIFGFLNVVGYLKVDPAACP